jgi:hypothetical protein
MNPKLLKAMKAKKKRAVDPNAPPRPNLMTHNVKIRTLEQTIADLEQIAHASRMRIEALERKLQNQTAYLQGLHDTVSSIRKK